MDIRIIYQKSDRGSGSDGVVAAQSGMDGYYSVRLTNTVQPLQHIRTMQVGFWHCVPKTVAELRSAPSPSLHSALSRR